MREKIRLLKLTGYEQRVMVAVLNEYRNIRIGRGEYTDDVDELLIKTIDAPLRRHSKKDQL